MTVERYRRSARRYHTAIYVATLLLLATGWWLLAGREGVPSPIASISGLPDVELHVWLGWSLAIVALVPLPFALRGVAAFLRETVRVDRGDGAWLVHWPIAVVTGRFRRHEGHFDPGQRIANVAIVGLLGALIVSGIGLVLLSSGPAFAVLDAIHRLATIGFTVVIIGHVIVAAGILPGYHGVWQSMHLGGRLRVDTARRLWPAWADSRVGRSDEPRSNPDVKDRRMALLAIPGRGGRRDSKRMARTGEHQQ